MQNKLWTICCETYFERVTELIYTLYLEFTDLLFFAWITFEYWQLLLWHISWVLNPYEAIIWPATLTLWGLRRIGPMCQCFVFCCLVLVSQSQYSCLLIPFSDEATPWLSFAHCWWSNYLNGGNSHPASNSGLRRQSGWIGILPQLSYLPLLPQSHCSSQ